MGYFPADPTITDTDDDWGKSLRRMNYRLPGQFIDIRVVVYQTRNVNTPGRQSVHYDFGVTAGPIEIDFISCFH